MNVSRICLFAVAVLWSCANSAMQLNNLHNAAQQGNDVQAERLISFAKMTGQLRKVLENRDKFGWTPLHVACHHGHLAVVNILLDAGASPSTTDIIESTPLHEVVYNPSLQEGDVVEIIKALVKAGAFINSRDINRWTALYLAARRLNTSHVIQVLKNFGAEDKRPQPAELIFVPVLPLCEGNRPEVLPKCPY